MICKGSAVPACAACLAGGGTTCSADKSWTLRGRHCTRHVQDSGMPDRSVNPPVVRRLRQGVGRIPVLHCFFLSVDSDFP